MDFPQNKYLKHTLLKLTNIYSSLIETHYD